MALLGKSALTDTSNAPAPAPAAPTVGKQSLQDAAPSTPQPIITAAPAQAPLANANLLGPQAADPGILGKTATVDSAVGMSIVTVPMAESVITSVDAEMHPSFTTTVTVPLAQLSTTIDRAKLANITAVHPSSGPANAGVSFQMVAGALQVTLAGTESSNAINATELKLFCASGDTVLVNVHANQFHVDQTVYQRADLQQTMASAATTIATARAANVGASTPASTMSSPHGVATGMSVPGSVPRTSLATAAGPATAAVTAPVPPLAPAPGDDAFIAHVQQEYRAAKAQLDALAGARSYVTLDDRGFPAH